MAARESQGLQIALILFVMITVALGVTTYIFFNKWKTAEKTAQTKVDSAVKAAKEKDAALAAYELIKRTVGQSDMTAEQIEDQRVKMRATPLTYREQEVGPSVDSIEQEFNRNMTLFGNFSDTDPKFVKAEDRNYVILAQHLLAVIQEKNKAISDGLARESTLRDQMASVKQSEEQRTKKAEDALRVALLDKDKIESDLRAEVTRIDGESKQFVAKHAEQVAAKRQVENQFRAKVAEDAQKIAKASQTVDALSAKVRNLQEPPTVEAPDGKINWVSQRERVVWVNIGSADGLRRGTTFSILDRDATNIADAIPKGSIEILEVTGPKSSQARIVRDSISDPILAEDLIFSPTWQAGEKLHVALVGFVDYNGDGRSDLDLVKNVIIGNNGVIDAEMNADGRRSGKMTIDTRYVVVGDKLNDKSSPAALQTYTNMMGEAQDLGIEQISVKKLLSLMGFEGEAKTVGLGRGADSGDFAPRTGVPATSNGSTSGIFKERRPPARGGGFPR